MEGVVDEDRKDRFEACMKLADFAAGRWDARRSHEAALSFGIWGAITAAILCVRANQFPWAVGVVLVLVHAAWLGATDVRNRMDGKITWNAVNAADNILSMNIVPPKPKLLPFDWALPIKLTLTVGLVLLFYVVCVRHPSLITVEGVILRKP